MPFRFVGRLIEKKHLVDGVQGGDGGGKEAMVGVVPAIIKASHLAPAVDASGPGGQDAGRFDAGGGLAIIDEAVHQFVDVFPVSSDLAGGVFIKEESAGGIKEGDRNVLPAM